MAFLTLYYCSGDRDIVFNGITYLCGKSLTGGEGGPFFGSNNKFTLHQKIGTETDTVTFDVIPGEGMVEGQPFLAACQDGSFDGAEVSIDRCFMTTYGDTAVGAVNVFTGRIGEVDTGRSVATFTVNSWLEFLNQQFPRNLFSPGCCNSLYDATCGVVQSIYLDSMTAVAGSTKSVVLADFSVAAGYYDLGSISFTSGALDGVSRSVRAATNGTPGSISLLGPLPVAPQTGDTFSIFPGCDKSLGPNGCPKFFNQARFRGEPFIPQPATAV